MKMGGQSTVLTNDCLVTVIETTDQLAKLSNEAVIDRRTMRGFITKEEREDAGALQVGKTQWMQRTQVVRTQTAVRCWPSRAAWEGFIQVQRAWNKLHSRINQHDPTNLDRFTVESIEAAELALFGNVEA